MLGQVPICPDMLGHGNEFLVELFVTAVEVGLQELLKSWRLFDDAEHLWAGNKLISESWSVHRGHSYQDCVEHKILEFYQLRGRKSWHHVQKKLCRFLPLAVDHEVHALIDLELVPPLPVASLSELSLCPVDVLLHEILVFEEESNADDSQDVVHLGTNTHCFFEGFLVALQGRLLVTNTIVEVGLRKNRIADLDVSEVLLGISDLLFKFDQLFLVGLLHLGLECFVCRSARTGATELLVEDKHTLLLHCRENFCS
mmetsp:Transcript_14374/g.25273  ORF Transcript_14374/g.25273 Transcript_14374/m.25273 type:complete len:256 (+) Transcript_14374:408-1175(+)